MDDARRYFAGIALVLGYITIASLQSVALNAWLASVNVYLLAGLSFLIVTVFFAGLSLRRYGTGPYRSVLGQPGLVLALNVTAIFNWLFYFLAVKYLLPAVAVTLTQGVGPLSMTAYSLIRREPVSRVTRACHAVILVAAALMCFYVVDDRITNGAYGRGVLLAAIAIAVVCSVSITATVRLSKSLAVAGIPASVVLSVRFPMLVVACLAVLPTQQGIRLSGSTIVLVFGVALVGIATSAYLLQRGIELAPPLAVSTCLALSPVVVFAIGAVRPGSTVSLLVFALIAGIVLASLASIGYDGTRLRRPGKPLPVTDKRPDDTERAGMPPSAAS